MTRVVTVFALALWCSISSLAQTPVCDSLSDADRKVAEAIMATEYLYDCCDDTIAACLAVDPVCDLAVRLADNVCRRVASGQDEARIRRGLSRRARSMMGRGAPAEIDLSAAPAVGPQDAPVTLVVYACARCPYCSKLVPELYEALTEPPLADDVRMAFRIFPIRGHEGSTPAGLGFAAAVEMDAFWPFLLHAYGHFDEFDPEVQADWAESAGLEREAFQKLMADSATRDSLVASKKEGLVNGVEETPTLFINGRRWVGDLETAEVLDALAEEAERVTASSRSDE